MRPRDLKEQNRRFARGGGVSANNRRQQFMPAFKDARTQRVVLSRFRDGRVAPFHTLEGLPEEWVVNRDPDGRVLRVRETIIAGFVRDDLFYTREEAAEAVAA